MIPSIDATRQACNVVDEIRDYGVVSELTYRELVDQAFRHPRRAADMLVALAQMVSELRPQDVPRGDGAYVEHLTRAHAAFARGDRDPWVLVGERAYNTLRRKQARERKRAG